MPDDDQLRRLFGDLCRPYARSEQGADALAAPAAAVLVEGLDEDGMVQLLASLAVFSVTLAEAARRNPKVPVAALVDAMRATD